MIGESTVRPDIRSLADLGEGQKGCVTDILITGPLKRRLWELGLISGADVACLQKSPYGDPVAYEIKGAVIALRNDDTKNIWVRMS